MFFSTQYILGQNKWARVPNPNGGGAAFEVFGENYYRMPSNFLETKSFANKSIQQEITLPNEKGEEEVFLITPAPLLSESLLAKYPKIKTFKGRSKSRPKVQLRLSTLPNGINAWLRFKEGSDYFIQPAKGQRQYHFSYLKTQRDISTPLICKTEAELSKHKQSSNTSKSQLLNDQLRTFRIAVAGTAEYTEFWGDDDDSNGTNAEDAFAAVASTINRINVIFENDLNIRLELVSDAEIMYEDSATDPFTGNFDVELQAILDEQIGDENYDVGHLFDFGEPNGDAGCIGCVCVSGEKGQGFSTHPFRDIFGGEFRNDYFDLDYAGHEIGHQFGAYHTFSHVTESAGVNAEPGSGSTIMGYAGITGSDDIQEHGDPYFHYFSIQNILSYVETLSCGETEDLGLEIFTIDAGPDYVIPIETAYELKIDPIEDEAYYTYCWEQLDNGKITSSNFGPENLLGAMTRSLPPTEASNRYIPKINRILSDELTEENPRINSDWETVSSVGRILNWGLSVRRQNDSITQLAKDKIEIEVSGTAGPFRIISHDEQGLLIQGGSLEQILWDVAKTDQIPVNTSELVISLSTDGGLSFPIILADGVPNNGAAEVLIPNDLNTNSARIKIRGKGNIFFAINTENFSIAARDLALNFTPYEQENCSENSLRYTFTIQRSESFDDNFSLELNNLPAFVRAQFSKSIFNSSDTTGYVNLIGLSNLEAGQYRFNLEVLVNGETENYAFLLNQRSSELTPANLLLPENNSELVNINPILQWDDDLNTDRSRIQLAHDADFENIVLDTLVSSQQLQVRNLEGAALYYWRIQQQNNCDVSQFSSAYSFGTTSITCADFTASSLPKDIQDATDSEEGITLASININFQAPILDLNVLVDLTHSWVGDLTLYLQIPSGDRLLLGGAIGGDSGDNYTQTLFDQEATQSIAEGVAPFTGSFVPIQDISSLNNTSSQGTWSLVVIDQYTQDTGVLKEFSLYLCVEGVPEINSDNDTFADDQDNCPEFSNEDQADIDENGIGDICDIFSSLNLSLSKKDSSCSNNENGSFTFNARADFLYRAEIIGPNGFRDELVFTNRGATLNSLAPGEYELCVYSDNFPTFEYCFETEINAPETLNVQSFFNPSSALLNLDLSGSEVYEVLINEETYQVVGKDNIQLPLNKKLNHIEVKTPKLCQGVFEQWINLESLAKVYPNPVSRNARLILPQGSNAEISLLTGTGELVWTYDGSLESNGTIEILMESLPRGWYLLQIDYGSHSETRKLLKE